MKTLLVTILLVLPSAVFAAKDCRVIEYADHIEAICIGDPKYKAEEDAGPKTTGATVSKKRGRIEEVKSLNAGRFDVVDGQAKVLNGKLK